MLRAQENATPSASIRRTTAPTRSGAPSGATICACEFRVLRHPSPPPSRRTDRKAAPRAGVDHRTRRTYGPVRCRTNVRIQCAMAAPPMDRRQPLPGKGGPPARARVSRFLGRISAAPEPEKEPTLVGRRGVPGRVHPLGRVSACRSGIHLGSRTPSLPAGSCRRPSPPPACRTRSAS